MVRVIAGSVGGHKLKTIDSEGTKPTLDRVKEAMFSILLPWTKDAVVIDLFAGNGCLGIEALSRGSKKAYFNDKSRNCVEIINANLTFTNLLSKAEVFNLDYMQFIKRINQSNVKADMILLDPPYGHNLIDLSINAICQYDICSEVCIIMAEHAITDKLSDSICDFAKVKTREYGNIALTLYSRKV